MALFRAHNQITRNDLGRMFAGRQYDSDTFGPNYSDLTPDTVEGSMARWFEGKLLPFVIERSDSGSLVAFHYLHDMSAESNTAWVGGYIVEGENGARGYGSRAKAEKTLLWKEYALPYISRQYGHPRLFAYCMDVNVSGKRWAIECCGLTVVGTLLHAIPEEGTMADIEVYTLDPRAEGECRRQCRRMFPEGEWKTNI